MTVQCLTDIQKEDIYFDWVDGESKAALGRLYCVSSDTITRVINEVKEYLEDDEDEDIDSPEFNDDFIADGELYCDDEDEDLLDREVADYSFVMTPDSISITRMTDDEVDTVNVDDDHEKFEEVYNIIINDPRNQDRLADAYELLNIKTHIGNITNGRVTVFPEENRITYTNDDGSVGTFSGRLVDRIIQGARDGQGISHLIAFANRLADNPSYRAVNELYDFLEAADININQEGLVECFKRVKEDYTDVFTGTFDNSPGQICSVPRNMVDEDSNQTCSYGLHVCSYAYLGSYPGQVVIKVLVDPADFVAIPADYYSYNGSGQVKAKARVSKYHVVEDITSEIQGY